MSSRDLVGRPLVPFFDADDNVNESLDVDYSTRSDVGHLDVDARVWDRDLGYFVYPDGTPSTASTQHRTPQHSAPIAIPPRAQPATTKTLLTPDMLFSRSAPTAGIIGMDHAIHSRPQPTVVTPPVVIENGGQTRSASAKRASQRSKRRSNTPTKTAKSPSVPLPQQSSTDVSSSSSDNATNDRKTNNATPKKNRSKKKNNNGQENATEDLSTNGKWAWSAFQSSPDPKSLPLPPFVVGGGGSPALGAAPPPKDPPNIEERLDPPPAPPAAVSLEHSMTQDLRRLLNIGS